MKTSSSSSKPSPEAKGCGWLKEFLPVGFDISGKAEGVIACALFGQFGVTLFERFDNGHMLGQRGCSAVHAPDRQLPVAANVQQDIACHIAQHRRFAR